MTPSEFERQRKISRKYEAIRNARKKEAKQAKRKERSIRWLTKQANKLAEDQRKHATLSELKFRNKLRELGIKYKFQYPLVCYPNHYYVLDFYLPDYNIGVEMDGPNHYTTKGLEHDNIRDSLIREIHSIKIHRVKNEELIQMDLVVDRMVNMWFKYAHKTSGR